MANEVYASAQLRVDKTYLALNRSRNINADMAGNHYSTGAQSIGHSAHEALAISSDVTTAGYAFFVNLDATNYVEIGRDVSTVFVPFAKLKPGQMALVPLATTAIYAKANTATVVLEYWVVQE